MKAMLARLRDENGVELVEKAEVSILRISKTAGIVFDVTIPHAVLEWFVDVRDSSGSVWSEWADYYSVKNGTKGQLLLDMESDIERFVTVLLKSEVRVLHNPGKAGKEVELAIKGSWRRADLNWMTADQGT
jgi:hypothetical protein